MPTRETWDQCTNILCVRLDNMGDVLMTTPALRALQTSLHGRRLTLLTSSAGAAIAPHIRYIHETISFDVPWVKGATSGNAATIRAMVNELRHRKFDAAVLFTVYSQNPLPPALLCYMADIPHVLGYCRENPYQLIDTWVPDPEPSTLIRHEVRRQLDLVAKIGAVTDNVDLSLRVPRSLFDRVLYKLAYHGVRLEAPWLLLHAGATEERRRYPPRDYVIAAKGLIREGWQIVLTGGHGEEGFVQDLTQKIGRGAFTMAGQLTVGELCAAIKLSPLLIANNTGPVHIAAAAGTPVVVLYAQTNPQHTPWRVPSKVLYFPVPEGLRSKNQFLLTFQGPSQPIASPGAIVAAVRELMEML